MKLIFIYGLPASGKLTVAKKLAISTGFKLFHNHLVVDMLQHVFDFGSPEFVRLREEIWLGVFTEACHSRLPGLIFTFAPETTVSAEFIPNMLSAVENAGGEVVFIELTCALTVLKQRLTCASRLEFGKLASVELFEHLHAAGHLDSSRMPLPTISIDTDCNSPEESAAAIAQALSLQPSFSTAVSSAS